MVVAIHVFTVLYAILIVAISDEYGLSWMLGRHETLSAKVLSWLHYLTWAGLLVLIASGTYLALPRLEYLFGSPLFVMKMLFVALLVLNAHLIGKLTHVAATRPFSSLTFDEKIPLLLSGALSATGWGGAILMALLMFH